MFGTFSRRPIKLDVSPPMPTFGLFLLSLINNNNMHGPKLPPNESPKTLPRHYLQQTIDNRP